MEAPMWDTVGHSPSAKPWPKAETLAKEIQFENEANGQMQLGRNGDLPGWMGTDWLGLLRMKDDVPSTTGVLAKN